MLNMLNKSIINLLKVDLKKGIYNLGGFIEKFEVVRIFITENVENPNGILKEFLEVSNNSGDTIFEEYKRRNLQKKLRKYLKTKRRKLKKRGKK